MDAQSNVHFEKHGVPLSAWEIRAEWKGPIPDLSRVPWDGRSAFIIFGANVHTNDSVNWARKGIARELTTRGAEVQLVNLPAA
jgi:hypothetical protein